MYEKTETKIREWILWLKNESGPKLDYPSKVNFVSNKMLDVAALEADPRPIGDCTQPDWARDVEAAVCEWMGQVNQVSAGLGTLMKDCLLWKYSGIPKKDFCKYKKISVKRCEDLVERAIFYTHCKLYPADAAA